jgi:hypothetical protein
MPRAPGLNVMVHCDPAAVLGGPDTVPVLALFLDEDGYCQILAIEERRDAFHYPESVRLFRDLVWRQVLPRGAQVTGDPGKVHALAAKLRPLLDRVRAGHSVGREGGSKIGQLTPDAREACKLIQRMIGAADWTRNG